MLALRTNSGRHDRNVFCVVPELGATVGYQVTRRLKATVGYTFIYWSRVARPGDHIDLDITPDLLPPELDPVEGDRTPIDGCRAEAPDQDAVGCPKASDVTVGRAEEQPAAVAGRRRVDTAAGRVAPKPLARGGL